MFTLFLAIACGGSGDSGGGDNTGNAGGSYVYDGGSSTLTITISSSDFEGDCGPEPGTEDFTVTELTATTMIWLGSDTEELTWTRNSGNAGDPVGTWTMSEGGVDLQLVIDGDGGFSLSGTCDDSGSGGGGGGSNPALLIGTWDVSELQGGPDAGSVPSGTVLLVLTDTTFSVTDPDCVTLGTYTATSETLTTTTTSLTDTTGDGSGDCGSQGEVNAMDYTVNSTTLTLTIQGDVETMIFTKQ